MSGFSDMGFVKLHTYPPVLACQSALSPILLLRPSCALSAEHCPPYCF
jgi:hypothetical protein